MDVAPNALISFHMIVWLFRKYLQLMHFIQAIIDFFVNTTQQVISLFCDVVKWFLHPFKAIKQIRGFLPFDASVRAYANTRPVSTWIRLKSLELSASINTVPICAQETETTIMDFFGSIDLKGMVDYASKLPQKILPCFNANNEGLDADVLDSPEPEEEEKRNRLQNWKFPSVSFMFAGFKPTKIPEEEDISSLYSEKSRPASKPEKVPEQEVAAATAEAQPSGEENSRHTSNLGLNEAAPEVSDTNAAPVGDTKSMWGGRRRKRRPSAGNA